MLENVRTVVSFGGWVKQHRKLLGLSRKELAERTGYSTVTIVKIEAGERRPSKQVAELLAKGLELSSEEQLRFVEFSRLALRGGAGEPLPEPPELAGHSAFHHPNNLPAPATSFAGRESSVRETLDLMRRPGLRNQTEIEPQYLTGGLALVAHAAYHLGNIRQMKERLREQR